PRATDSSPRHSRARSIPCSRHTARCAPVPSIPGDDVTRTVLAVFGTRPEAIKMAPVLRALAAQPGLRPAVCVTDQHREMLDQVLEFFGIQPDYRLDVMRNRQMPSEVAARILERLPPVLAAARPAAVLVQGDTTTTMAASLAAFYARIPVGHVEAGLRTGDPYYPYPEEINRRITTVIAARHFAPTEGARRHLLPAGIDDSSIAVTGNPVLHALLQVVKIEPRRAPKLRLRGKRLILVTAHRRENFGEPLREIIQALRDLASRFPDVDLVYPVHRNPSVNGPVREALRGV